MCQRKNESSEKKKKLKRSKLSNIIYSRRLPDSGTISIATAVTLLSRFFRYIAVLGAVVGYSDESRLICNTSVRFLYVGRWHVIRVFLNFIVSFLRLTLRVVQLEDFKLPNPESTVFLSITLSQI